MSDNVSVQADRQPRRGSYPRLVVRVLAGCYQHRAVPGELTTEDEMIANALALSAELNLCTCLVLGPDRAWYCEPDGSRSLSDQPPSGGMLVPEDATFVCKDGTVRQGSPRGLVVPRAACDDEVSQE